MKKLLNWFKNIVYSLIKPLVAKAIEHYKEEIAIQVALYKEELVEKIKSEITETVEEKKVEIEEHVKGILNTQLSKAKSSLSNKAYDLFKKITKK